MMLKLSSVIIAPFFLFVIFIGISNAQENPYAIETSVIKNEQAIKNLRQQQANLYLKMEDLLVKYGELKGRLEDIAHRLYAIESRLNSLASQGNYRVKTPTQTVPHTSQNSTAVPGNNIQSQAQLQQTVKSKTLTKRGAMQQNIQQRTITKYKAPVLKPPVQKATIVPSDEKAYLYAKGLYDNKHYGRAIQAFENFKKQYRNSEYLPDAIFYVAQIHFNRGEYDKAIISYDYLINTYPKNSKAPTALLKEGISFIKLGDNIDGKYLLKKTIRAYPNSKEAVVAKQYLGKIK